MDINLIGNKLVPKQESSMKWYHFIGDGSTQFGLNAITGLIGMLTYFYTDKIGLSAGVVGTILLITKIIDAFTDLAMGSIVDKTKSKFGKVRPWFLWMSIPVIVSIIAIFYIPANETPFFKGAYALITNIIATAIVYTAVAIPYGCLVAVRTNKVEERSKMGIIRSIFGYISGMIISVGLIPITNMLGGNQKAWIIISVIFGVTCSLSFLATFVVSKEDVVKEEKEEKISFKESLSLLFKNKYWVIMFVIMFVSNIGYSLSASTGIYYAKYVLANENLVGIMGAIGLIPVIIGFAIIGPMVKRFGLASTTRITLLMGIIANIIRAFIPYSFMATLVCGGITTFATIPMMSIGGVLINNTIEYGEWIHGKRIIGMTNSVSSFGAKIGAGIGTAMIGWILAIGNYDGSLIVQPHSAIQMILILCIYLPLVLFIIMYLILRKYDLDNKYQQIIMDLDKRKNE